jgi:hypothetical protein
MCVARSGLAALAVVLGAVVGGAGCGGTAATTTFQCVNGSQCNLMTGGICAPLGYCAYPDTTCPSGYKYSSNSGTVSGQCVVIADAGVTPDMPPPAPFGNGSGLSGGTGTSSSSAHFRVYNAVGQGTGLGPGNSTSAKFEYAPGNLGGK